MIKDDIQMVEEIRKKNSKKNFKGKILKKLQKHRFKEILKLLNSWKEPLDIDNYQKFQRKLKKKFQKDFEIFQILNWKKKKVHNNSKKNSRRESLKFSSIWRASQHSLSRPVIHYTRSAKSNGQPIWNVHAYTSGISVITCSKRVKASGARDPRA